MSAPLRISIAGGGTDLPELYQTFGGELLAAAIHLRIEVSVRPRADGMALLLPSRLDPASEETLISTAEVPGLLGVVLRRFRPQGAEVRVRSPITPGAGLGGSGAFAVAAIAALEGLAGLRPAAADLVHAAFEVERRDLGAPVGFQDHYAAAFGGLSRLRVDRSGRVEVSREPELERRFAEVLSANVLLCDTRIRRPTSQVLGDLTSTLGRNEPLRRGLAGGLHRLVRPMREAILAGSAARIGELHHLHWTKKRRLTESMSSALVDEAYAHARSLGAYGGKLIGAGGGGFLILYCPEPAREQIGRAMASHHGFDPVEATLDPEGVRYETQPMEGMEGET